MIQLASEVLKSAGYSGKVVLNLAIWAKFENQKQLVKVFLQEMKNLCIMQK